MRAIIVAVGALLAGCSVVADDINSSIPKYIPPSPPSPEAQVKGLQKAIAEEKLIDPVQIAAVRPSKNGGPGAYFICFAGGRKDPSGFGYYTAFFENEDYKSVRPAVILDLCEAQSYLLANFPTTPPKPATDNEDDRSQRR